MHDAPCLTYTLVLYPRINYYGEPDIKPLVQEVSEHFAVHNRNVLDRFWLYEIILVSVDDVYDKDTKRSTRKTTRIIVKREALENMLI